MLKPTLFFVCAGFLLAACATLPPPPLHLSQPAALLDEASGPVYSLDWTRDGHRLVSAGKGEVRVWEPTSPRSTAVWKGHSSYIWGVAWSPDETLLASIGSDGVLLLRDGKTGAVIQAFPPISETELWALAWSPDGKTLAAGNGKYQTGGQGQALLWSVVP